MRMTVHIDDDAYRLAVRHAKACNLRLGKAISDLIVRGALAELPLKEERGLVLFDPPDDLPETTIDQVKQLAEEW